MPTPWSNADLMTIEALQAGEIDITQAMLRLPERTKRSIQTKAHRHVREVVPPIDPDLIMEAVATAEVLELITEPQLGSPALIALVQSYVLFEEYLMSRCGFQPPGATHACSRVHNHRALNQGGHVYGLKPALLGR